MLNRRFSPVSLDNGLVAETSKALSGYFSKYFSGKLFCANETRENCGFAKPEFNLGRLVCSENELFDVRL